MSTIKSCLRTAAAILVSVFGAYSLAAPQTKPAPADAGPPLRISGPHVHENLAIYLVHGPDQLGGKDLLTLAEALDQKKAIVHETGNVNELTVENLTKDQEIFIQAGDIVRGGKQDRVISIDIIIASNSGKVPVNSFCVERGRWRQRGGEAAGSFSRSEKSAPSKQLKLAILDKKDQGEVWNEVGKTQQKLSRKIGAPVASRASVSSLQLSLENRKLNEEVEAYVKTLSPAIADKQDVVGIVVATNGKLNNSDVYASPKLFRKLWPKLLDAAATEAIAVRPEGKQPATAPALPDITTAEQFLATSGEQAETTSVSKRVKMVKRETQDKLAFDLVDTDNHALKVHSSQLSKETPDR